MKGIDDTKGCSGGNVSGSCRIDAVVVVDMDNDDDCIITWYGSGGFNSNCCCRWFRSVSIIIETIWGACSSCGARGSIERSIFFQISDSCCVFCHFYELKACVKYFSHKVLRSRLRKYKYTFLWRK
jgi:hypothetical protein